MPLDDIFSYFQHFDTTTYQAFSCHGQEPSESDIAAFEAEVGFRLPEEFREFTMSWLGGLYVEVREEIWPRAERFEVGPFWSFLYGFSIFGISPEIPDWLDLRVQYRNLHSAGYEGLVPFLQRQSDPDIYCFDSAGKIVYFVHDDPGERTVEPLPFSELLMREIRALEERKDRKLAQKRE
jgi:hypothetical protein